MILFYSLFKNYNVGTNTPPPIICFSVDPVIDRFTDLYPIDLPIGIGAPPIVIHIWDQCILISSRSLIYSCTFIFFCISYGNILDQLAVQSLLTIRSPKFLFNLSGSIIIFRIPRWLSSECWAMFYCSNII